MKLFFIINRKDCTLKKKKKFEKIFSRFFLKHFPKNTDNFLAKIQNEKITMKNFSEKSVGSIDFKLKAGPTQSFCQKYAERMLPKKYFF